MLVSWREDCAVVRSATADVTGVENEAIGTGQLADDFRRRKADSEPERGPD